MTQASTSAAAKEQPVLGSNRVIYLDKFYYER